MTLLDVEISVNGRWVKNGDQWFVEEVAADGAVTVARTMGVGMPGGRRVYQISRTRRAILGQVMTGHD